MVCYTAPGVGHHHRWRITHDGGSTSALSSDFTSYEAPIISNIFPSYGDAGGGESEGGFLTQGGENVVLNGSNFGPLGTIVTVSYLIPSAFGMHSPPSFTDIFHLLVPRALYYSANVNDPLTLLSIFRQWCYLGRLTFVRN